MLAVAAAIIRRGDRILVSQRLTGKPDPLKWEFPGGKVDDDETPDAALVREIQEELGISISIDALIDRSVTPVGDNEIDLACYLVTFDEAPLQSTDHDALRWVSIDSLPTLDWAAPDLPAVALLASPAYRSQLEQYS